MNSPPAYKLGLPIWVFLPDAPELAPDTAARVKQKLEAFLTDPMIRGMLESQVGIRFHRVTVGDPAWSATPE